MIDTRAFVLHAREAVAGVVVIRKEAFACVVRAQAFWKTDLGVMAALAKQHGGKKRWNVGTSVSYLSRFSLTELSTPGKTRFFGLAALS
jgi:hypothetical protein